MKLRVYVESAEKGILTQRVGGSEIELPDDAVVRVLKLCVAGDPNPIVVLPFDPHDRWQRVHSDEELAWQESEEAELFEEAVEERPRP
ncbi:MAG: hypothetical protein ACYDDZ_11055 [Acidimicrobiales bacterium]